MSLAHGILRPVMIDYQLCRKTRLCFQRISFKNTTNRLVDHARLYTILRFLTNLLRHRSCLHRLKPNFAKGGLRDLQNQDPPISDHFYQKMFDCTHESYLYNQFKTDVHLHQISSDSCTQYGQHCTCDPVCSSLESLLTGPYIVLISHVYILAFARIGCTEYSSQWNFLFSQSGGGTYPRLRGRGWTDTNVMCVRGNGC